MKKLKMLGFTFVAMIMCMFSANAADISFSENSSNGNITMSPANTNYKYQWVHVDYQDYTAVEAKLKGIVQELKDMAPAYNELVSAANTATANYQDAYTKYQQGKLSRTELAPYATAMENANQKVLEAKEAYDVKADEFFAEVEKIAPRTSTWNNVTSGTIAFDKGGIDYGQADAAVIWVDTGKKTHRYEAKIYMYQEADGSLRAEVDCPVIRKFCEVADGKYYGKDGSEVSKETYENQCLPKVCSVDGGKYYGLDGTEVDANTYKEQCENPTCEIKNDKYYDNNGKEVTEEEYNKLCNPTCKVEDGKYYGPDGKVIDKAEYDKLCSNPKTGFALPITIGIIIIGGGAIAIMVANKKKLFKQI